jgi:predicted membrane GTPase involved in stress response
VIASQLNVNVVCNKRFFFSRAATKEKMILVKGKTSETLEKSLTKMSENSIVEKGVGFK